MERRLSRRQLIAGGAAGVGAVLLARELTLPDTDGAPARGKVVVLGGGLAGLTAAHELEHLGFEVQIVEARTRLGGRVHTIRDFADDQHAESGGESIDSGHAEIRGLCERFGLPLEDAWVGFGGLAATIHRRGRNFTGNQFRSARVERQMARFWRRVERLASRLDPADPTANGGAALDRHTVTDLLDLLEIEGRARWLLSNRISSDYGFDPGHLSLLYLTISERLAFDQPSSGVERYRIEGGNSTLVEELARRLITPPIIGAPALAVTWDDSGAPGATGVEVTLEGGETVQGDRLVLAAPPTALRAVDFTPSLPAPQAAAIAAIDLCPVAKTLVQYDQRIWRRQGRTGGSVTDLGIDLTWGATDQQPGRRGVLIAYMTGPRGQEAAGRSAAHRIAEARTQINEVFPGSRRISGDSYSVAWAAEPFSGGGWAAYSPGQITRHWLALHDPVGPIHMAGEHTQRLSGYMNSAVASGQRVAAEIDSD